MSRIKGVYVRKDGRCQARYKKGVGPDGRALYGIVYGKSVEEVVEKRRAIVGDEEDPYRMATEMNLLILGAGSHGRAVKEIAESLRVFRKIAFLDDEAEGEQILGKCREALQFRCEYSCAFVAIGDNRKRRQYAKFLKERNFLIPNLISPAANVSNYAGIGEGVAIMSGATVGEAGIGDFCVLESNSLVNNGVRLGAYSHVGCGGIILSDTKVPDMTSVGDGEIYHIKQAEERLG